MGGILYRVNTNLNSITINEVAYTKKTDSFFWVLNSKYREAINTNWVQSFDTKEEAVSYLESKIKNEIHRFKNTVEHYEKRLDEFNLLYK